MSDRFPEQMLQAGDNNLDPIAGAKLNFYITGTTTRKDTYSDDGKTIPNANPVVADAAGRFGDIFMDTDVAYKVVYTDAADVVIQTFEPFDPVRATNVVETPVTTKSSNFTVLESERGHLYEIDASAGSINATLLQASVAANNFEVGFKKVDSSTNPVTVDGFGAETIDGQTDQVLAEQYDCIVLVCDGTTWHIKSDNRFADAPLPRFYLAGLGLKNDGTDPDHDIVISEGECRDSTDTDNIVLSDFIIKQIDASWVAGNNQGGLSSSLTLAADTWYHVHAIIVAGAADAGFDTSATAANLIADHGATAYRRIGSVLTDGSSNIIGFVQTGDDFRWSVPVQDVSVNPSASTAQIATLTTPTGVKTLARFIWSVSDANGVQSLVTSLDETDTAPSTTVFTHSGENQGVAQHHNLELQRWTDTSSQIRWRVSATTVTLVQVNTVGWIDRRGRDD